MPMATSPRTANFDPVAVRELHIGQVEDLLKLQKAAQKITSILDLDQLIDRIVNDVAHSFGCLEANVYLHDEVRGEMELAGVHGCCLHQKGHRLKVGKEGMVGYVAATGQCATRPMCAGTNTTLRARNPRFPKWRSLFRLRGVWWESLRLRIANWMRFLPSNSGFCRPCAVTLRSPCTMPVVFSRSGSNGKR